MTYDLGFIGTGNMGSALARAAAKTVDPARILLCNRTREKAGALANALSCASGDNETAARESRFIVLGVKPQGMTALLHGLAPILKTRSDRFCLITMAAGLTAARVAELAGGDYPVIRIMPNTPVAVGEGMVLACANQAVTGAEKAEFERMFSAAGRIDWLDEALIDAGSAVSGCGPAFVCLFMEALADGGVAAGLPRKKALEYAAQTLLGTARLAMAESAHPAALKDSVCSPGGSTIAGVRALEQHAFRAACMDAVIAAWQRTRELGQ